MGKRIISQRRGRGTSTYRAQSHRSKAKINYKRYTDTEKTKIVLGKIVDLVNCPGHNAPLAKLAYDDKEVIFIPAPENVKVNGSITSGQSTEIKPGNILPLKNIPEGTNVYNIELVPGEGGKLVRSSGTFARVVSHLQDKTIVRLPSKTQKLFDPRCRATIGVVAGSGRTEKPIVKAGKMWHMMHARGKLYPRTSGVAMNAVDHPFGSGRGRQHAKIRVASRFASPGSKVGMIRARKSGRSK